MKKRRSIKSKFKNTKKSVQMNGIICPKCGCSGDPNLGCPCCGKDLSKYGIGIKRKRKMSKKRRMSKKSK